MSIQPLSRKRLRTQKGNAIVEFSLCFLLFLSIFLGFAHVCFAIFVKATLHHAVREGVRVGITGETSPGRGHDNTIKDAVKANAIGLLSGASEEQKIKIKYYREDGGGETNLNLGRNLLEVTVEGYSLEMFNVPLFPLPMPTLTVSAVDKLEPYRVPPSRADPIPVP
jgi:hypothetical protein